MRGLSFCNWHARQAMAADGSVKTLRVAGPGDLISGAGSLLAAGARRVQGVRNTLQGTTVRLRALACSSQSHRKLAYCLFSQ